jgi:hypothetical protein
MKVGDLVQTINNGAGIGDSWIDAGHLGLVVEVFRGHGAVGYPRGERMVGVLVPDLGKMCHYYVAGWEVVGETDIF